MEATFIEKQDKYAEEKDKIGNIAAEEIEDGGDTIILDSGTTTWHVPKYIEAKI